MIKIIIVILIGILAIMLWKIRMPEVRAYEAHMCAVYGYEVDCTTKLK